MNRYAVVNSNWHYRLALRRERNAWKSLSENENPYQLDFLPHTFQFKNQKISMDDHKAWLDVVSFFGPFENGLILGGGNAGYEDYLQKTGYLKNIENVDIIFKPKNNKSKRKVCGDLNFIQLKENQFDIIIAKSVLHHIINLEHLISQVNSALKPSGIFVVFEYVGENKQQWNEKKLVFINQLLKEYSIRISRPINSNIVPFESIRSEEIPGVLDLVFGNTKIVEEKWDRIYTTTINSLYHFQERSKKRIPAVVNNAILEKIVHLEMNGSLKHFLPTTLFGIYTKNFTSEPIMVNRWNHLKIKKEFDLNLSEMDLSLMKKCRIRIKNLLSLLC